MRKSLLLGTALALFSLPTVAAAQQVSFSFGAALVSEYEANGIKNSDGFAFQPYVEAEIAGFYAGIWASNVQATADTFIAAGDTFEYDLYAGYRNSVGGLNYDVQYARYFYNTSGDCCGEAILSLSYDVTPQINLGTRFAWDTATGTVNSRLFASFAVTDALSLNARYGTISNGGHNYWSVGADYAVSDLVSLSLAYHGHDNTVTGLGYNGLFVGGISVAFSYP